MMRAYVWARIVGLKVKEKSEKHLGGKTSESGEWMDLRKEWEGEASHLGNSGV